jgi:dethiobiotin synthetase
MTIGGAMLTEHAAVRLGITGTDTEIGKTVVSCALAALARARPAARRDEADRNRRLRTDARGRAVGALRRGAAARDAAGVHDPIDLIRPIAMVEPLAPMVAAVAPVSRSISTASTAPSPRWPPSGT